MLIAPAGGLREQGTTSLPATSCFGFVLC